MRVCLRCGSELIQNPIHPHWSHCPNCDPTWASFCRNFTRLNRLDAFARAAAADQRGLPTIGGSRLK